VQLLADMKPGFIRFPGGCIVEGRRLELRYDWKKTVGELSERKSLVNRWNEEFAHRPAPDYFQSFGLGFFEYFQLAEDIGASPLPIVNCGTMIDGLHGDARVGDRLHHDHSRQRVLSAG
jgi:alpha-N-arabinofuranosidase